MSAPETTPPGVKKTDWLSILVTLLVLTWIVGVVLLTQLVSWLGASFPDQLFRSATLTASQVYFAAALIQAIALLIPLVPLALLWRAPRHRAAYRIWLAAVLFCVFLSPVRLIPSTSPQLVFLAQAALAFIFALGIWFLNGRTAILQGTSSATIALAFALGILLAIPWLVLGALGSFGDVIVGLLTAFAFALAAILLVKRYWLRDLLAPARGTGRSITFGGAVIGALLLILGSVIGISGTQFFVIAGLSALGWLLMVLASLKSEESAPWNDAAFLMLTALGVAAPLLLLDSEAAVLQASLAEGEVLVYAMQATGLVILGAWVLGVVLFFLRRPLARVSNSPAAWAGAGLVTLLALVLYFYVGQPGLFGDRVFVIFKSQADVSAAASMNDYDERRAFVFNTLTAHANETQKDLRGILDSVGIQYKSYYLVNALEVSADLPVQWWLATRGEVDRVLPSPRLRPLPAPPPQSNGSYTSAPALPEWNLTLIGADRVWKELDVRGAGVLVGQSDSGVQGSHPELTAQYRGRDGGDDFNWLDPWNGSAQPTDIGGHGTHTLGSILGKTVGVAPDAEWIGCVNLARNLANPALYLDCMQFNFAPYPQAKAHVADGAFTDGDPARGAMVLNNSWGCPAVEGCDPNALLAAVRALRDAGVFVVASAGNDGPGCSTIADPIALYDEVFSVAAVDSGKELADFSSRGPVLADDSGRVKPDIAAPGVDVYSALPGSTYGFNSGTSMAGPHIAGVVALLWSANPALIGDIDRTEQIIRETAQRADVMNKGIVCGDPTAIPNDLTGYGIVDAYAAVERALAEK